MEKYSQFSVQGVNPFISGPEPPYVLCFLVIVLKLPLILVSIGALLLSSAFSALLPPTACLWWRRTILRLAARLALCALGVWHITYVRVEKHSVRSRPSPSVPRDEIMPGDIIVSNHASWVDALVLAAVFAPQFTVSAREGGLRTCTIVEAMLASLKPLPARLGPAARETTHLHVTAFAHGGIGPLLVFPEVCNTLVRFAMRGRILPRPTYAGSYFEQPGCPPVFFDC